MSDAELVSQARRGFKEPMAELLHRHWDTAIMLAGRVLGSADLARDAVQEAAIAAMTDLERLRSPDSFGAWFCGITLNVSRRWLRQLQSEVPGLLQSEVPGLRQALASATPDPAEAATADIAAEHQQRMREAAQRRARQSGQQPGDSAAAGGQ